MFANPRFLSGRQTRGHPAALECQVAYKVHAVLLIHAGSLPRAKQTVSFFPRSYRHSTTRGPTLPQKKRAKQQSQCKSKKRSNIPIASTSRFARFQWHSVQGILRPWMYSMFVLVALARIPPYTLHNSATVSFFSTGMAEFGGIMAEFGGIILPEIELVAIL